MHATGTGPRSSIKADLFGRTINNTDVLYLKIEKTIAEAGNAAPDAFFESTKIMPRVSRSEAEANRARVARTASRMYREGGIERVSVAEVMTAAGMTVGA